MKKFVIAQLALIAINAFGETNVTNHSPIIYWIDSISYAQDEASVSITRENIIRAARDVIRKKLEERNREIIKGKVETSIGGEFSDNGAHGGISGSAMFGWELESVAESRARKEAGEHFEKFAQDEIDTKKTDWKLRFNINFKNEAVNQLFEYAEGGWSGVFLKIKDVAKWKDYTIPVPTNAVAPDVFVLQSNGGEIKLTVEMEIPNRDFKQILRSAEICGALDKCVTIIFDGQFKMLAQDTKTPWNYKNARACKIAIVGFGTEISPIKVNGIGLTYKEVLELTSNELPPDCGFVFSEEGSLDKVYKRAFGKFANDEKGVYVILAETHGKYTDHLSNENLIKSLSPKYDNNDLSFMRIGVKDIYENRAQYPVSVISNCLSYVRNTLDVQDNDLFACAMLAKVSHDYELFGHCLSRIDKINDFLKDEQNKSLAMSLIIESNNLEHFKKLYRVLGWSRKDRTMLGFAAEKGAQNIITWLLEYAPENKREYNIDRLIDGATTRSIGDAGKTPFFWAALNGHLEVCQYLALKGADITRKFFEPDINNKDREYDELINASYITDAQIRAYVEAQRDVHRIRGNYWWESLRTAKPKDVTREKIEKWVEAGVLPGSYNSYLGCNWNFLSWAVDMKDAALVGFLIDKGAEVNDKYAATPDEKRTALMLACEVGDTNLVSKLISKGADLHAHQDDGMNAFYYAVKHGRIACAEMLLDKMDIAKCSPVKDSGRWLNLFEYVGRYCEDGNFCKKIKSIDIDAWIKMLVFWHEKGFRDCLGRCHLEEGEIRKLLQSTHTVQMIDDLYELGYLRGNLPPNKERESLEAIDPIWRQSFSFWGLREKAEQGDIESRYELGVRYGRGIGVAKDFKKAFNNFRIAAEGGHPKACYNISVCYSDGLGTPKDKDKAAHWEQKAMNHEYKK